MIPKKQKSGKQKAEISGTSPECAEVAGAHSPAPKQAEALHLSAPKVENTGIDPAPNQAAGPSINRRRRGDESLINSEPKKDQSLVTSSPTSLLKPRAGQRAFERFVDLHRVSGLLARRQYGKTTIASRIALKKMMKTPGHDVVFGSVKLDLGREIVRKESAAMRQAISSLAAMAAQGANLFQLTDGLTGKTVTLADTDHAPRTTSITADDFDELYEAQRLEFRLYHSNTIYSRTKVVALSPDAVGETGDLILDEVGRVKKFREVWEAVHPIISSNPRFRCLLTTTPPPDDSHYSFELLAPPIGTDFKPNPAGNSYQSDLGVWVLRIDAWDAFADGVPLFHDDTGAPITPQESRAAAPDKDAWDRNYGVRFVFGGTSACGLLELDTAQRRGIGQCALFQIETESDLDAGIKFLMEHLGRGTVGIGIDLATTEKEMSNPTSVTIMEERGVDLVSVAVFVWKTKEAAIAEERITRIVTAIPHRPAGGRARRMAVDATNERYFADRLRTVLGAYVPVELVIASETVELPGKEEKITRKQWLGDMYVAELNDNHLTLPPERYLKEDHRLPRKEKGQFVCVPDPQGRHGDTFDSGKLARWALKSSGGAITSMAGVSQGFNLSHGGVYLPPRLAVAL